MASSGFKAASRVLERRFWTWWGWVMSAAMLGIAWGYVSRRPAADWSGENVAAIVALASGVFVVVVGVLLAVFRLIPER